MSVLESVLLILHLLLLLKVDVHKTECALGDPSKYTKGVDNHGRLKYDDYHEDLGIKDFETSHRDAVCVNDVLDNSPSACSCTYVKDFGGIYSCGGDNIKSIPNLSRHASNSEIRLYNLIEAKNVNQIESNQFQGMKIKEIRIKSIETLTIKERAFQGILNLEILKITNNNLSQIKNPKFIFAGLDNLTTLDLSQNQITGWDTTENETDNVRVTSPVLPKLKILNLSGNPISRLDKDSFSWLEESQLKHLILHNCFKNISIEPGTLLPVSRTLSSIDLSGSQIRTSYYITDLLYNTKLQSLSLASIGMQQMPIQILEYLHEFLQYLSLSRNPIRKLGQEETPQARSSSFQMNALQVFPLMPNLEELDLRGCLISFIEPGVFNNLPKLKSLLLSTNLFDSFSNFLTGASKFSHLTYLDVSYNPIYLEKNNLTNFPVLETLDLSSTKGGSLTRDLFKSENSTLKKLSLCYTGLKSIENDAFSNLMSLEILDLSGNIELGESLSSHSFKGLTSLEELHLAECKVELSSPQSETSENKTDAQLIPLDILTNLRRLNLQRNDIEYIPTKTLQNLQKLDSLDLSKNLIRSWNEPMFSEISGITSLNIGHNYLSYITDAMLIDFQSLVTLVIASNPFVCDCNGLEFLKMIDNITEASKIGSRDENQIQPKMSAKSYIVVQTRSGFKAITYRIDETRSFTRNWDTSEEYLCMDKSATNNQVNTISFKNITCDIFSKETEPEPTTSETNDETETIVITVVSVSLLVIIIGGITYWKWWYIRYFAILVKNATVLSFMSNSDESLNDRIFVYDVFISYSDRNREWVLNNLLTNLESTSNIKVCLHERDFQVGIGILENIIACMDQSRSILLVISHQFLKSQWCQFELHLAQHRLLETRREELILLFLEDIPRVKRPKTLHYLMKTKTYIQWPQNAENTDAVKLFWKRLHNAILRNSNEVMGKRCVSTV